MENKKINLSDLTCKLDAVASNYGTDGGVRYYQQGIDAAGNTYKITWDTLADWDGEREEDACDWENPLSIELVEEVENQEPETLDELLAQLKSGALNNEDWSSLPTFGGDEPYSTAAVWSWDKNRMLVGTCIEDMEIVNRADR